MFTFALFVVLFIVVEGAFLVWIVEPGTKRWAEPISSLGAVALFAILLWSFWGHGVNTVAALLLLVSLLTFMWATTEQMKDRDVVREDIIGKQLIAVLVLIPSFFLTVYQIDNVEMASVLVATGGFMVYELSTVAYLAQTPLGNNPRPDNPLLNSRTWLLTLMVTGVVSFGLGLGSMVASVVGVF